MQVIVAHLWQSVLWKLNAADALLREAAGCSLNCSGRDESRHSSRLKIISSQYYAIRPEYLDFSRKALYYKIVNYIFLRRTARGK